MVQITDLHCYLIKWLMDWTLKGLIKCLEIDVETNNVLSLGWSPLDMSHSDSTDSL